MLNKRPFTLFFGKRALAFYLIITTALAAPAQGVDSLSADSSITELTAPVNTTETIFNKALSLYNNNQFNSSIELFNQCLALDSTLKQARYLKALAWEKTGHADSALQELNHLYILDNTYNDVPKRIKTLEVSVYLSRNWYYMIAMAVLLIIFLGIGISVLTAKKG